MLSIQAMGAGTTEQPHLAPALLHALWAIRCKKNSPKNPRARPIVMCVPQYTNNNRYEIPLTADLLMGNEPLVRTADKCPFLMTAVTSASGLSRAQQLVGGVLV